MLSSFSSAHQKFYWIKRTFVGHVFLKGYTFKNMTIKKKGYKDEV